MIQITSVASSSKGNCYRIDDGSTPILIEVGLPWPQIRKRLNFRTSEIQGILVSHSHMDHCKGAEGAIKAGIPIYSAKETLDVLGITTHHRAIRIKPLRHYYIGTWAVVPFKTVHDAPGSLGFFLASGDYRLLFITDTAFITPTFKGLTHIMIEANFSEDILDNKIKIGAEDPARKHRLIRSHLSIERVIDLLKANDLSKVESIHLLHLSAGNSDEELFKRMVQEATGKAVFVEAE